MRIVLAVVLKNGFIYRLELAFYCVRRRIRIPHQDEAPEYNDRIPAQDCLLIFLSWHSPSQKLAKTAWPDRRKGNRLLPFALFALQWDVSYAPSRMWTKESWGVRKVRPIVGTCVLKRIFPGESPSPIQSYKRKVVSYSQREKARLPPSKTSSDDSLDIVFRLRGNSTVIKCAWLTSSMSSIYKPN